MAKLFDRLYRVALGENFRATQQRNAELEKYMTDVGAYMQTMQQAQMQAVGAQPHIPYAILPGATGATKWEKSIQGPGTSSGVVKTAVQPVSVGNIVFQTNINTDDSPAEKDRAKRITEQNLAIADSISDSLKTIAKNSKKTVDQDTGIKKSMKSMIKFSKDQTNKSLAFIKEGYKKAAAKLPKVPDFSKYTKRIATAMIELYYKLSDYMLAIEAIGNLGKLGAKTLSIIATISTMPLKFTKALFGAGGALWTFGKAWVKHPKMMKKIFLDPVAFVAKSVISIFTNPGQLFTKAFWASAAGGLKKFLKMGPKVGAGASTLLIGAGVYWILKAADISDKQIADTITFFRDSVMNMSVFRKTWNWIQENLSDEGLTYHWQSLQDWWSKMQDKPVQTFFELMGKSIKGLHDFALEVVKNVTVDMWKGIIGPIVMSVLENIGILDTIMKWTGNREYMKYKKYGRSVDARSTLLNVFQSTQDMQARLGGTDNFTRSARKTQVSKDMKPLIDEVKTLYATRPKEKAKQLQRIREYKQAVTNGNWKLAQEKYLEIDTSLKSMLISADKSSTEHASWTSYWSSKRRKELIEETDEGEKESNKRKRVIKKANTIGRKIDELARKKNKTQKDIDKITKLQRDYYGIKGMYRGSGSIIDLSGINKGALIGGAAAGTAGVAGAAGYYGVWKPWKTYATGLLGTDINIDVEGSWNKLKQKASGMNFSMPSFGSFNGGQGLAVPTLINGQRAIQYPNGKAKVGGSRSWRNNNPGNLGGASSECERLVKKYARFGAIGCDYPGDSMQSDWRGLIFSTMEGGLAAKKWLLKTAYGSHTIMSMGIKYQKKLSAAEYGKNILRSLSSPINPYKPIGQMTDSELTVLALGISGAEGFKEGKIVTSSGDVVTGPTTFGNISSAIKSATGYAMNKAQTSLQNFSNSFSGFNYNLSAENGNMMVQVAQQYADKGIGYVWGGGRHGSAQSGTMNGATSYDCSSFVAMVVNKTYGIPISKYGGTVRVQYSRMRQGNGKRIPWDQKQPGDILFMRYNGQNNFPSHTGIYIGNNKMIHASGSRKRQGYQAGRTGVVTTKVSSPSVTEVWQIKGTAKNHVTGSVSIVNQNADQMFMPGVGMVSNGGDFMQTLEQNLTGINARILELAGGINTVAKEQLNKARNRLEGEIDVTKCKIK